MSMKPLRVTRRKTHSATVGGKIKRLSQKILLHDGSPFSVLLLERSLAKLLGLGLDVERYFEELLVEERDACFQPPSHGGSEEDVIGISMSQSKQRKQRKQERTYLLARKQSAVCRFSTLLMHSLWKSAGEGAAWKYK